MKNFIIITESINFIEENLCNDITREAIAEHCHVSLSMLEKLFRYALHISIKDYILRRRMTQAAKDLTESSISITDLAMKYQFNSVEVFSRAFRRVWNVNPSQFKSTWRFTGIYPKKNFIYNEGDDLAMAGRKVDMSESYEFIRQCQGSYVLCFDMQNLVATNAVSTKAGDLALLEMAGRIDRASSEDMLLMRIGGDEFALITGLYDIKEAEQLRDRVLSQNGNTISFEGRDYPVSLWCGITQVPERLRYNEFFTDLHKAITESKA